MLAQLAGRAKRSRAALIGGHPGVAVRYLHVGPALAGRLGQPGVDVGRMVVRAEQVIPGAVLRRLAGHQLASHCLSRGSGEPRSAGTTPGVEGAPQAASRAPPRLLSTMPP